MSAATVFGAAAGQGRDWIAARIPHQGRMCLLDRVDRMSAAESVCSAISHTDADNPLREGGRLGAIVGQQPMMRATFVRRTGDRFETTRPWDVVTSRLRNFPEPSSFRF